MYFSVPKKFELNEKYAAYKQAVLIHFVDKLRAIFVSVFSNG